MFSNSDYYNLDSAKSKVDQMKLILDLQVKLEALEKILVQHEVIGSNDVSACIKYLKSNPPYKTLYDYFENQNSSINYYKNNPEQHLRDLFKAKVNGDIK